MSGVDKHVPKKLKLKRILKKWNNLSSTKLPYQHKKTLKLTTKVEKLGFFCRIVSLSHIFGCSRAYRLKFFYLHKSLKIRFFNWKSHQKYTFSLPLRVKVSCFGNVFPIFSEFNSCPNEFTPVRSLIPLNISVCIFNPYCA